MRSSISRLKPRLRGGMRCGLWRSEFADFGESADFATRGQMLDEGLDLLQKTWAGSPFDHEGDYYRAKGETFCPGGAAIPIWIAASWPNRKPFRRASRFDGVMAVNRDFNRPLSCDDVRDIEDYIAQHRDEPRPFNLAVALNKSGDPSADVDRAQAYAAAGADWWQEGVIPTAETLDDLRSIVRTGPPR